MNDKPETASRTSKILKLLLKLLVTTACLWYVFTKVDIGELTAILRTIHWPLLLAGFVVFILSKLVASLRLNIYFRCISLSITEKENLRLFWLGMFYNLFLPGSITGDAYKVILLSRRFDISYRKPTAAVLLDRFSGLLGLGIIMAVYAMLILDHQGYIALFAGGAIAAVVIVFYVIKRFFADFLSAFWSTFFLGLAVQAMMVICIYMIIFALGIESGITEYVFIFLVAAVAGVLPLTVGGGLGIREFVFYKGALVFGLNEQTAVIISLLFYFVTLVTSLFGVIYIFKPVFPGKLPAINKTAGS